MSGFCCPPVQQSACETVSLIDAAKLAEIQAQLDLLIALNASGNISPDLWKDYLKIITAAVQNTDLNSLFASSSAVESLKLFNANYKLLKDSFESFYDYLDRVDANLTYTIREISTPYTLQESDVTKNTIFRVNQGGEITIPILSSSTGLKGKIFHVRNNTNNLITVRYDSGVTIEPLDALHLRRKGSTIGLIYLGNNVWDTYGELP